MTSGIAPACPPGAAHPLLLHFAKRMRPRS